MSGIKVNGVDYVTFTYGEGTLNDNPTEEVTSTNANGDVCKLIQGKNADDEICVKVYFNDQLQCEQTYNDDGTPATDSDGRTHITRTYSYDDNGFVTAITDKKYSEVVYSESYAYNAYGELSKITTNDGDEHTYTYRGDFTRYLQSESPTKGVITSYERDYHFRPVMYKTTDNGTVETAQISWMLNTPNTVNLPVVLTLSRSGSTQTLTYTYDTLKNITSIADGSNITTYEYDKLNRLVKEVNPHFGTCEYSYDKNGNITSKKINGVTYAYIYDGDKLMSFNGKSCTYDAMGNPTTYLGKSIMWIGKNLRIFGNIFFYYDGMGRRYRKDSVDFTYDSNGNLVQQSDGIKYFYNASGVAGMVYNGTRYHYSKDVQGNIIALLDSTGKVVVQYWYDAWGNHKVVDVNGNEITDQNHIGNINPFRYRGYYFDIETGLYYLQTRYYDPTTGRFLNRDSIAYADPETLHGLNFYAYCLNNPIKYADPTGRVAGLIALIVGAVLLFTPVGGAIVQGATSLFCYFGFAVASLWDEQIKADMNAIGWNPFNTNEAAVLQSGKVSFYKGVPVIRYIGPENRSGSFAAIFLDISEKSTNTIRHEWGHTIQQLILGPGGYGLMIGLPSAFEWSNRSYYSRPWEITADIFGGVSPNAPDREYTNADIYRGFSYLGVSSIAGIFGYLFLLGEYF